MVATVVIENFYLGSPFATLAAMKAFDYTASTSGTIFSYVNSGLYVWSSTSTAVGDDLNVVVPNNITPPAPGRLLRVTTSLIGTANQVLVSSTTGTTQTGVLTLSLPQSIATTSAVQFGSLGLGVAPSTAGRIQTTAQSLFGSSSSFTSVASHEFDHINTTGIFINLWVTGTNSQVSAGGNATGVQSQVTYNNSAGTQQIIDAFTAFPSFSLSSNLPQANSYRSAMTFSSGLGLTISAAADYRAAASSSGGFTGTITNRYGFYSEAMSVGTNRYGAYFLNPTGGTIAIAAYTDNLSVGYNVTPPVDGAIISGKVSIGTSSAATSAILTLSSTTLGFLPPVMTTTQRNAIVSPVEGLTIYNSTTVDLESYNGSAWIGASTSGVTSLTGTANQVLVNGTSGSAQTGALTLTLPQSIATTSTVQFGSIGINAVVPGTNIQTRITAASTNSYNMYVDGTLTSDDTIQTVGMYLNYIISPSANNRAGLGFLNTPTINASSTNTITSATGAYFALSGSAGSGSVTDGASVRVIRATVGTTRSAISTADILVGYSGVTPPSAGMLVSGQTLFKATSSFISASVEIQGSDRISLGIGGTKTSTDGFAQAATYYGPTFAPSSSTSNVSTILSYPNFTPSGGITITNGYNIYLQAGAQSGAGAVTNGYNLYVENPGFGTTKWAIYSGGAVRVPTITIATGAANGYVLTSDGSGNASWSPSGSGGSSVYTVTRTAVDYAITTTDDLIAVTATAAPFRSIALPYISGVPYPAPTNGKYYIIKDESGTAATHNIQITCSSPGGGTFEGGGSTYTITTNYGWVHVYLDQSTWYILDRG